MYDEIISLPNLLAAWREFQKGKKKKSDVLEFAADAEEHILKLHDDLTADRYRHGGYVSFFVRDPKLRHIHKASVRDRLLHHAVHRVLYPYFNVGFIFDSYSSRENKGTHAAIKRFRDFAWKLSRNRTRTVWILKADIRKFFDSIDHEILMERLREKLPASTPDPHGMGLFILLQNIIESFETTPGKGIPLGNLTSQLFSNIYLDPLDQFVKRGFVAQGLNQKYYIRYADDIIVISSNKGELDLALQNIQWFLEDGLSLFLHPRKVTISRWGRGVDILGFISSPYSTTMRPNTKRRMLCRLVSSNTAGFEVQLEALYSRVKFER